MFSIHRKLFLALKKVRIIKSLPLRFPSPGKKFPPGKFPVPYPLPLFGKPWRCYGIMCTAFDRAILYVLNCDDTVTYKLIVGISQLDNLNIYSNNRRWIYTNSSWNNIRARKLRDSKESLHEKTFYHFIIKFH